MQLERLLGTLKVYKYEVGVFVINVGHGGVAIFSGLGCLSGYLMDHKFV
jgi:hypothetical protein